MTKVDSISIQTLCHATEEEERVLEAVQRLYPAFKKRKARGYFKNPIYFFEAHITTRKKVQPVLALLEEKVAPQLKGDLHRRVDGKGNIYIRLDKQELYKGNYLLKDSGEVKIVIHMKYYPSKEKDVVQHAEGIFSY